MANISKWTKVTILNQLQSIFPSKYFSSTLKTPSQVKTLNFNKHFLMSFYDQVPVLESLYFCKWPLWPNFCMWQHREKPRAKNGAVWDTLIKILMHRCLKKEAISSISILHLLGVLIYFQKYLLGYIICCFAIICNFM